MQTDIPLLSGDDQDDLDINLSRLQGEVQMFGSIVIESLKLLIMHNQHNFFVTVDQR